MLRTLGFVPIAALLCFGCDQDSMDTIGPRGGQVVSPDGRLTLTVFPDSFDEELPVAIEEQDDCVGGALACYLIEPAGTMPGMPALLTWEYDEAQMTQAGPNGLSMLFEMGESWVEAPDRIVNESDGTISASIYYFGPVEVHTGS